MFAVCVWTDLAAANSRRRPGQDRHRPEQPTRKHRLRPGRVTPRRPHRRPGRLLTTPAVALATRLTATSLRFLSPVARRPPTGRRRKTKIHGTAVEYAVRSS